MSYLWIAFRAWNRQLRRFEVRFFVRLSNFILYLTIVTLRIIIFLYKCHCSKKKKAPFSLQSWIQLNIKIQNTWTASIFPGSFRLWWCGRIWFSLHRNSRSSSWRRGRRHRCCGSWGRFGCCDGLHGGRHRFYGKDLCSLGCLVLWPKHQRRTFVISFFFLATDFNNFTIFFSADGYPS